MAVRVKDRIEGNIRQSDMVNQKLSIALNSGTATEYNGSSAKSINITPAAINAPTKTGDGASGTWNIIATKAIQLNPYDIPGEYNKHSLAYFNANLANNGTARAGINDSPSTTARWWHFLRFTHYNSEGYYTDLAIPFSDNSIYYKRISSGNVVNGHINAGWIQVLDQLNYTNYTVTKTGAGASGNWNINASTATKLATARTIALSGNLQGSANFDGSGNISINALNYQASINGGNKANYPWHRIATVAVGTNVYQDRCSLIRIRHIHTWESGGEGLAKISVRTNSAGNPCQLKIVWIYRCGIDEDALQGGLWGKSGEDVYADIYYKCSTWPRAIVENLSNGRAWTLISSREYDNTTETDKLDSYEVYTSVADGATKIRNKAYTITAQAYDRAYVYQARIANQVLDTYNGTSITFNYGAPALTSTSTLAAWNGYQLRKIDPNNLSVDSAVKLKPHNSAIQYGTSDWANIGTNVWGMGFRDPSLGSDSGDIGISLTKVNETTVAANLKLDGKVVALQGFEGNATSASKWVTARTLTLTGDVTGNVSFDGSANISLTSSIPSGLTLISNTQPTQSKYTLWVDTDDNSGNAMRADAIKYKTFSIATSAWVGSGPFTYNLPITGITTNSAVINLTLDAVSQTRTKAQIDWETKANTITLSTAIKPTGTITGYLITAEVTTV